MDGEGQRVPEAAVDFEEHRGSVRTQPVLDHGDTVPTELRQQPLRGLTHVRPRRGALAQRAARARRPDIAQSTMGELRAGLAVAHQSEVADPLSLDELL